MSDLAPLLVVIDAATLIEAQAYSSPTFRRWPHPPARSTNPCADALAVPLRRQQWGLALSESILLDVATVLDDVWQLPPVVIADYVDVLRGIADSSGGGVYTVPTGTPFGSGVPAWMHDIARLILAVEADAAVLRHPKPPLAAGTWDGCWITDPAGFAARAHTIKP